MIRTPLPTLVAMASMMGVMSILIGLLAEIAVRVYFESQSKAIYVVRDTTNFDSSVRHPVVAVASRNPERAA
jgi:dolichol-phosphate mannosyltransferase